MARFEKGNSKGNRFTKDNQPENPGRKPKIFSILKKKYGINLASNGTFTQSQIIDLLQSLLSVDIRQTTALNLSLNNDVKKIAEQIRNGETPDALSKDEVISQVFVALSQAINRETSKGESYTIRWIIEYLFGKATQPIEGDVNAQVTTTNNVDLSALSTEELLQYNSLLEKISMKKDGKK